MNTLLSRSMITIVGLATTLAASVSADAGFVSPSWRGDANTTYQEWNTFSSATEPNDPDVASDNPNGTAALQNLETSAFLTGGGNLYSFAAPLDVDVSIPTENLGADWTTTIILQIRTLGTEVDPASVLLTLGDGSTLGFDSSTELSRTDLGGFGGAQVETLYSWEVSGNAASYLLSFVGLGSSLSLDAVSVDTHATFSPAAVPEPTSLIGLASGLALAAGWIRTRKRNPPGRTRATY